MTSFDSQIRLHKWQVDEAQRRLAQLRLLEERFRADRDLLEAEVLNEQGVASGGFENSLTYAAYAARLIERRQRLDRSIAEVAAQIAEALEALGDAFAELKKFELAAEAAETRARKRRDRLDRQAEDEVSLGIFRRQAK
jgi:flagellar biosynthesis chaperone FliJ